MATDFNTIRAALRNVAPQLHARANVVATGVGYKISGGQRTADLSIVCSVAKKLGAAKLSAQDLVPATIDGTLTDVVESGRIRALQTRTVLSVVLHPSSHGASGHLKALRRLLLGHPVEHRFYRTLAQHFLGLGRQ